MKKNIYLVVILVNSSAKLRTISRICFFFSSATEIILFCSIRVITSSKVG